MKEITMYQALDGEVFDSAFECEEYERRHYTPPESIKFYDIDMHELRMTSTPGDYSENELCEMMDNIYNRAWYVVLKESPSLSKDIEDMHDVFGYLADIPADAKPGLYWYIGDSFSYPDWEPVDLDVEQEKCEETMARIAALRNLIK